MLRDINDNPPRFVWPKGDEFRHVLTDESPLVTEIVISDEDVGNNSIYQLSLTTDELFYIGANSSLYLRNASTAPGVYPLEFRVKNGRYETRKSLRVILLPASELSFGATFWKNLDNFIPSLSQLLIVLLTSFAVLSLVFLLIYYRCLRSNVRQRLYGSRLIVNDEEKCSTTMNSPNSRHKQRKVIFVQSICSSDNVSQQK